MIRLLLIVWFLIYSIRCRTFPWQFFQLNVPYFNLEKGIFSKLDLDGQIPVKWRLSQETLQCRRVPECFPVFMKPEWGQNSHGIIRADSIDQYTETCRRVVGKPINYIVQEAAPGACEFEVFYIRASDAPHKASFLSVTEVTNDCTDDLLPINGIYNNCSCYHDRTANFSSEEKNQLWNMLESVGEFRLARVGIRADSIEDLLAGKLHIFEINLFLPMPLGLLDKTKSFTQKHKFIRKCMLEAAKAVQGIPAVQLYENIFFKKMIAHYKSKK